MFRTVFSEVHLWQAAVLAQVPETAWVEGPRGVPQIRPEKVASMRFLSLEVPDEDAEQELAQVRTRRFLFEKLLDAMPAASKLAYRNMVRWVDYKEHPDPNVRKFPLSSDSAFGYNLLKLESLMADRLRFHETKCRDMLGLADSQTTPAKVTFECLRAAEDDMRYFIQRWSLANDSEELVPECLLAQVSANLSANRALLELAAMEARGKEAEELCVSFLRELNRQGLTSIPEEVDEWPEHEIDRELRRLLTKRFGQGGTMLHSELFSRGPMSDSDIVMVDLWSRELQQRYMRVRGASCEFKEAKDAHAGRHNRFIFALAMVGAFYCKTSTVWEFTGHSNPRYAVFPDPKETSFGNREAPATHAAQVLLQAYGMIFYANSGWNLSGERVREYAEVASVKRSYQQCMLRFAVKGRSSRELLSLHNVLEDSGHSSNPDGRSQVHAA
ncbi:conserved hypothetical protein [Burkholderia sp. H160]|nr:conserved hypothetical protein [Burkholderia sp. H160]